MPDDELDQILARGEAKLEITFEGLLRDRIIQNSDGFPDYAHMFALHCSRRAIHAGRSASSSTISTLRSQASWRTAIWNCGLPIKRL